MKRKAGVLSNSELVSDRDAANRRMNDMVRELASFRSHYRELSEFTAPRRGRFFVEDRNRGEKRHKSILNSHATTALRRATSGMMAGAMSPSRPWFGWDMMDKDVLNDPEVAQWLELLKHIVYTIFNKGNFYNMAPTMLKELLLFGTGAMTHEDDFEDVARFYAHTAGEYMIATDSRQEPGTFGRKVQMQAYQIVQKFGLANVSMAVENNFKNKNHGAWHTVNHLIELNPFRDETEAKFSSEFQVYRSIYWEENTKNATDKHKFLRRRGYKGFPVYVPRWEVTGNDTYGTECPGMIVLGDTKQLQVQERELAKLLARTAVPPLQAPPSARNHPIANLPGGVTINTSGSGKYEKLYDSTDPRIAELGRDIERTERRISSGYYNDLFRAITDMEGIQPKNQLQLSQINEERLLELGPVLEQVHGGWLAPCVQRAVRQVLDAGIMPPIPAKLEGQDLGLEFISALAMAQRSVATSAIEKTVGFTGMLAQVGVDVTGNIDGDYALREYASLVGGPVQLIRPQKDIDAAREQAAQKQQAAEAMEMANQGAQAAATASQASLEEGNVLSEAVRGAADSAGA